MASHGDELFAENGENIRSVGIPFGDASVSL
jgi:hypothetical protein